MVEKWNNTLALRLDPALLLLLVTQGAGLQCASSACTSAVVSLQSYSFVAADSTLSGCKLFSKNVDKSAMIIVTSISRVSFTGADPIGSGIRRMRTLRWFRTGSGSDRQLYSSKVTLSLRQLVQVTCDFSCPKHVSIRALSFRSRYLLHDSLAINASSLPLLSILVTMGFTATLFKSS